MMSGRISQADIEWYAWLRLIDAIETVARADDPSVLLKALQPHPELAGRRSRVTSWLMDRITLEHSGRVGDDWCFAWVVLDQWARNERFASGEVTTTHVLDLLGKVLAGFDPETAQWRR